MQAMEEEHHLVELLTKYDRRLAVAWLGASRSRMEKIEEASKVQDFKEIEMAGIREACCYRIKFRFPLLLMLSKGTMQIRAVLRYYESSLGLMPVYVPTLNIMTVLKTWGDFADNLQGPAARFLSDKLCIKFTKGKESSSLSSLNFLLRNDTEYDVEEDERITNLVARYFRYFFWKTTRSEADPRGSLFYYHDYYKIRSTHDLSKSIFFIDELKWKQEIETNDIKIRARNAVVRRLTLTYRGYVLERINCMITDHVLERIGPCPDGTAIIGIYDILNERIPLLIDTVAVISSTRELVKTLLGLAVTARFDANGSLGMDRGQIENDVSRLADLFKGSLLWSEESCEPKRSMLDDACRDLAPMILLDRGERETIRFLHPAFIGLMLHLDRAQSILDDPHLMTALVNLVENGGDFMKDRLSDDSNIVSEAGLDKATMLRYLSTIRNKIAYSKILRHC